MASSVVPNKLSEATNRFTCAVYKELIKNESENIVFSPLSIEVILWIMHCGAEGESAAELAAALHLSGNKEEIQNDARDLLSRGTFDLINLLFVQENLILKEPFLRVAENHFSVNINSVDFSKMPEAIQTMKKSVERYTSRWHSKPIGITTFDTPTSLVLGNAVGVTLIWASAFSPGSTKKGFFFAPGKTVFVNYLKQHIRECKFYESADFKAKFLALPTYLNKLEMVFVLPTERNGLSYLEQRIDEIALLEIPFESTLTEVSVPKFSFKNQIDFKKILTQLGVSKVFDSSQADLSGIAGKKGDIAVGGISHYGYIAINEGRSEVNVGTSYVRVRNICASNVRPFIANQPFIFLLKARDITILAGRVVTPELYSG